MELPPPPFSEIKDPVLLQIGMMVDLAPLTSTRNVFHDLVSCLVEQQIHYRSRKKQFARMLEQAGLEELNPENFGIFEEKALAGSRLSGRKWEALAAVVPFFQENENDWANMTDAQVRKELGALPGVGKWTVDMLLLYTLERPDICPLDDYHLKLSMQRAYHLSDQHLRGEMKAISEGWKPFRSRATRLLLAWKRAGSPPIPTSPK